jgi:hypothetical protein
MVRDLEVLAVSVAIGFCVWLGGSLLADQMRRPVDERQLMHDRIELAAPNQPTNDSETDTWVDVREWEISRVEY